MKSDRIAIDSALHTGRGALKVLPFGRDFYLSAPDVVARALLGKLIVVRRAGVELVGRIVETEAYFGSADEAAHAFSGKTARTEVLFGPPGHAYVYFVYGMHYCLNVSCGPEGEAGCVLIRALEPVLGLVEMAELRGLGGEAKPKLLCSGPGRLCQALGITRGMHNGVDVTDARSQLVFADDGDALGAEMTVVVTPRVGIRKAVERAARFYIEGSNCVSRA